MFYSSSSSGPPGLQRRLHQNWNQETRPELSERLQDIQRKSRRFNGSLSSPPVAKQLWIRIWCDSRCLLIQEFWFWSRISPQLHSANIFCLVLSESSRLIVWFTSPTWRNSSCFCNRFNPKYNVFQNLTRPRLWGGGPVRSSLVQSGPVRLSLRRCCGHFVIRVALEVTGHQLFSRLGTRTCWWIQLWRQTLLTVCNESWKTH